MQVAKSLGGSLLHLVNKETMSTNTTSSNLEQGSGNLEQEKKFLRWERPCARPRSSSSSGIGSRSPSMPSSSCCCCYESNKQINQGISFSSCCYESMRGCSTVPNRCHRSTREGADKDSLESLWSTPYTVAGRLKKPRTSASAASTGAPSAWR
jgi:hypothetical protein